MSRDGDFSVGGCTRFSCTVDVAGTIVLNDALPVDFGETFAVELVLGTGAHGFAGFELGAGSDFFGTGALDLSSDTPDVSFTFVPEPASGLLGGLGLAGLAMPRPRRRGRSRALSPPNRERFTPTWLHWT